MELKSFFAQDVLGNIVPVPNVYVYAAGTTNLVGGLKDANGGDLANPFTGNANGQIQLAAPDGDYDLRVVSGLRDFTMRVRFIDVADQVNAASASAATAVAKAAEAAASAASASAIVLGVGTLLPTVRPSLLLDFANSKTVDPRITFTRASTATYYDGKTVAKAEENLLWPSQNFAGGWQASSTLTINSASQVAPDGTNTADHIVETAATSAHSLYRSTVVQSLSSPVVFSVYAKYAGRVVQLCFGSGDVSGNPRANFDVQNGVLGTVDAGITASITPVGNGWYRCSAVVTPATLTGFDSVICLVDTTTSARSASYAGAGVSGAYIWGAQLEQRSSVTAYTPTITQTITNYIPQLMTAASGVPRLDHDSITGECKGLLIEEQRTNLLLRSQEFDHTNWVKAGGSVVANAATSPEGALTAEQFVEDTATGGHSLAQTIATWASTTTYTHSVYVKPIGARTWVNLALPTTPFGATTRGSFNLSTGQLGAMSNCTGAITPAGNGWYRCSITATTTVGGSGVYVIQGASGDNITSYTGDGYSGLLLWGAQLEAGAFPTSYIPTTSAQVTRSADAASILAANFTSWYRADEGTMYIEATTYKSSTTIFAASIGTVASGNNISLLRTSGGLGQFSVTAIAGASAAISTSAWTLGTFAKLAGAYKVNDFAACTNAGTVGTDASGILPPTIEYLNLGGASYGAPTQALNGHIKKFAFYPKRLTNSELQALTA